MQLRQRICDLFIALATVTILYITSSLFVYAKDKEDILVYKPKDTIWAKSGVRTEVFTESAFGNAVIFYKDGFRHIYPDIPLMTESMDFGITDRFYLDGPRTLKDSHLLMYMDERPKEVIDKYKDRNEKGFEVAFCVQGFSVFVHKDNPLEEITLEQLATLYFSRESKETMWKDLGATGPLESQSIRIYGPNRVSGSGRMLSQKLGNSKSLPFSKAVIQGAGTQSLKSVVENPSGIGISVWPVTSPDLKTVPIRISKPASSRVYFTVQTAFDGTYPLAQVGKLYSPVGLSDSGHTEFAKYILSDQPADMAEKIEPLIQLSSQLRKNELDKLRPK